MRFWTGAKDKVKMAKFELNNAMKPGGDQPEAISRLMEGLRTGKKHPDADGRNRVGQNIHNGKYHRGV